MTLSIIIPSYSEAENLNELLPQLKQIAPLLDENVEVIVVDTVVPTDDTEQVCQRYDVRHVRRENSNNFGDALRTGIRRSTGKYVVTMDADGSHVATFIQDLWKRRHRARVIIASRFVPGGSTDNSFRLTALSRILSYVFRTFAGTTVHDASSGFRLYDGERLRNLSLCCAHFDIEQELLVKMVGTDATQVLEIPYHFRERRSGRSKRSLPRFALHYVATLLRLRKLSRIG